MSDNSDAETVVVQKSKFSKFAIVFIWITVVALSAASLLLSAMALQRSKLDNDAITSIKDVASRLEKTADSLDKLTRRNMEFKTGQSDYLHNEDRTNEDSYLDLTKKYDINTQLPDDGTNQWLFSQDNDKRSQ